jgi:hypothetical protein
MRKIGAAVCAAALTFTVAQASAQTTTPSAAETKERPSGEQHRPPPSKDEPYSASHDAERPNPSEQPAPTTGQSSDQPATTMDKKK